MNETKLYPGLKDFRVFPVKIYGQIDVWSVALDEPVGCVKTIAAYRKEAKRTGWRRSQRNPASNPLPQPFGVPAMLLALSPLEMVARPVDLSPELMGRIVAECESYPEPPAFPCRATCALCGERLAADEDDGTGYAHQVCSDDAYREIENDDFNEWVESCERDYGTSAGF